MTKPLSAMTDEEKQRLIANQQDTEEVYEEEEEIDVPNQASGWHESTKDRQKFLSSNENKPKRNFIARLISDDDPTTLRKLPKDRIIQSKIDPKTKLDLNVSHEYDPAFDINEPIEVPDKPKRNFSWLHSAGRIILWVLHAFFMIGTLYFTYYLITLVRSPGITDLATIGTLIIVISIQISLFSVNTFVGTVIRR